MPIHRTFRDAARTAAGASALLLCAAGAFPALAQTMTAATAAYPAPVVRYAPEGGRQLIFVNNPERLELGFTDNTAGSVTSGFTYNDLADPTLGGKALLKLTVNPGSYRDLFEHVWNVTKAATPAEAQNPLYYGIEVYNPNSSSITVTLYGEGFVTGTTGGQPFADLLNGEAAGGAGTAYTVPPGHTIWVMRTDVDYSGQRPVNPGSFFSGVADFDVAGGQAVVYNLAYQNLSSVTGVPAATTKPVQNFPNLGDAEYMGFITRRYNLTAAPESRTYKGLLVYPGASGTGAGVVANLAFTVDDTTPAGALKVTYPQYVKDATTGLYGPSATVMVSGTGWYTHNTPLRDTSTAHLVGNDLFDILTPGYGTVFSLYPTYAPNTPYSQANVANWGVTYHDAVTVTNSGTRDRTFTLNLSNNGGGGSAIAYLDPTGAWQQTVIRTTAFPYYTFTVPAGQTVTTDGYFVLGAPSVGTLRHSVSVTN